MFTRDDWFHCIIVHRSSYIKYKVLFISGILVSKLESNSQINEAEIYDLPNTKPGRKHLNDLFYNVFRYLSLY